MAMWNRSKEQWEESERQYQASRRPPNGQIPVRIVGTTTIYPSMAACARALKVSERTVSNLIKGLIPDSDVQIEVVERPL